MTIRAGTQTNAFTYPIPDQECDRVVHDEAQLEAAAIKG